MDPTAATNEILKLGLPGAIIVILLIALFAVVKAYHSGHQERLKDQEEFASKYETLLTRVMDSQRDVLVVLTLVKEKLKS